MAKSGKAVVVFHMTGCHACHDYLPRFKRVAVKYRPFVDIKQVNISHAANQDAADKYKINAAPTTVILDAKGKRKYSMAWVTSLPVSKDNVAEIVACGRARWKIENESFNVLKNHGAGIHKPARRNRPLLRVIHWGSPNASRNTPHALLRGSGRLLRPCCKRCKKSGDQNARIQSTNKKHRESPTG